MALITGGTTVTTSLLGLKWNASALQADVAQVANNIKNQGVQNNAVFPGGLLNGKVVFPNRVDSQILLLPGDYVFYDSFGWPIVISRESIAAGGTSWAHT